MTTYLLVFVHLTLLALISSGLSYLIMRWTFSPTRHKRLFETNSNDEKRSFALQKTKPMNFKNFISLEN